MIVVQSETNMTQQISVYKVKQHEKKESDVIQQEESRERKVGKPL